MLSTFTVYSECTKALNFENFQCRHTQEATGVQLNSNSKCTKALSSLLAQALASFFLLKNNMLMLIFFYISQCRHTQEATGAQLKDVDFKLRASNEAVHAFLTRLNAVDKQGLWNESELQRARDRCVTGCRSYICIYTHIYIYIGPLSLRPMSLWEIAMR